MKGEIKTIQLNDRKVTYFHQPNVGAKRNLVLFHGTFASQNEFKYFYPLISKEYNVFGIDLPGFGKSDPLAGSNEPSDMAEWLHEVCLCLGLKKIAILGHSMGGVVGIEFAVRYPSFTDRLLLVACPVKTSDIYEAKVLVQILRLIRDKNLQNIVSVVKKNSQFRGMLSEVISNYFDKKFKRLNEKFGYNVIDEFAGDCDVPTIEDVISYVMNYDLSYQVSTIRCQVFAAYGGNDNTVPPQAGIDLRKANRKADVSFIDNADHWSLATDPEMFKKWITNSLRVESWPDRFRRFIGL